MKTNISLLTQYAITFTIAIACLIGIYFITSNHSKGIHIISGEAVYLSGYTCVINTPAERAIEEIEKDFEACMARHSEQQ